MWFLLVALAGCTDGEGDEKARAGSVEIDPSSISFGSVEFGATATTEVVFRNGGDVDSEVDGLVPSAAFSVDEPGPFVVAPGEVAVRSLQWTATSIDGLHEHLSVEHGGVKTDIPVNGKTSYAILILAPETYDFGSVMIGCERSVDLVLTNAGSDDLVVSSIAVDSEQLGFSSEQGSPLEVPLTIPARTAATVRVSFGPLYAGLLEAELVIDSNDPSGSREVRFDGEGFLPESNSLQWTVEGPEAVTALVNVNEWVVSYFGDELDAFVPALFDGLFAIGRSFRLAIVMDSDGVVDGDVPYIDDSFTPADAVAAAERMLQGTTWDGDNDEGLATLGAAIESNEEWLIEDGPEWAGSQLNLVVINFDAEQSPGDAAFYIHAYEDYKDATDIAVHGIAGDVPGGCVRSGLAAAASRNLYDATVETGGVFFSFCSPDWTKLATELAAAFNGGAEAFVLDGAPDPTTIEVTVDGAMVPSGWSYDEATNSIVFDKASPPPPGSDLRVDYRYVPSCK